MTTDPLAIDVDYSELSQAPPIPRESSGKVVELSRKFPESSQKASRKFPESSGALAEALKVSAPTICAWMRRFGEVVPPSMLSHARGHWTQLAAEMAFDFADYRARGWVIDRWMDQRAGVYIPAPAAVQEAFVQEAERQGAIVPAAIVAASDARGLALAQAQSLQGFAGALLEQVGQHLAANAATAAAEQDAISEAAIVASEMAAILREQQLRAKVRAGFDAQQSAAAAVVLEQKLSDLRGAS